MRDISPEALAHPSVQRLKRIATAIGELRDRVVFIGGAISPLLQEASPFDQARVTKDVDGIIATSTYTQVADIAATLNVLGFTQSNTAGHVHRWTSKDGDLLDLVPAGQHIGASGQAWDEFATEDHLIGNLGDNIKVRYAAPAAFLALKWAAFRDRGANDPGRSHDLEDIVAVVVSRSGIATEVDRAPDHVRRFVITWTARFLAEDRAEDYLAGCLNRAQDQAGALREGLERLRAIRALKV